MITDNLSGMVLGSHMKRLLLLPTLCILLLPTLVLANKPIYRWLDQQGNPVFSDQPKGERRVWNEGEKANLYPIKYQQVRLVSYHTETPNQRIIRVYSQPKLQKGHTIELQLNRDTYQSALHSQYFLLHHLPRGHHKIRALIRNQNKTLLHTSRPSTLNIP